MLCRRRMNHRVIQRKKIDRVYTFHCCTSVWQLNFFLTFQMFAHIYPVPVFQFSYSYQCWTATGTKCVLGRHQCSPDRSVSYLRKMEVTVTTQNRFVGGGQPVRVCLYWCDSESESDIASRWVHRESSLLTSFSSAKDQIHNRFRVGFCWVQINLNTILNFRWCCNS